MHEARRIVRLLRRALNYSRPCLNKSSRVLSLLFRDARTRGARNFRIIQNWNREREKSESNRERVMRSNKAYRKRRAVKCARDTVLKHDDVAFNFTSANFFNELCVAHFAPVLIPVGDTETNVSAHGEERNRA